MVAPRMPRAPGKHRRTLRTPQGHHIPKGTAFGRNPGQGQAQVTHRWKIPHGLTQNTNETSQNQVTVLFFAAPTLTKYPLCTTFSRRFPSSSPWHTTGAHPCPITFPPKDEEHTSSPAGRPVSVFSPMPWRLHGRLPWARSNTGGWSSPLFFHRSEV